MLWRLGSSTSRAAPTSGLIYVRIRLVSRLPSAVGSGQFGALLWSSPQSSEEQCVARFPSGGRVDQREVIPGHSHRGVVPQTMAP